MTDDELQAIQARADAATPGPWGYMFLGGEYHVCPESTLTAVGSGLRLAHVLENFDRRTEGYDPAAEPNAEFIANARSDIPALLAEVRRLRAANGELLMRVRNLKGISGDWVREDDD